jgi:hypothetical protein
MINSHLSAGVFDRLKVYDGGAMRWVVSFVVASVGGLAVLLLVLWALNGFHGLGIGLAGTIAVALGVLFTGGLGVALMGLIFYSDRSHADEDAHMAAKDVGRRQDDGADSR